MKFCINCDQNTEPRRDMSGAKKFISLGWLLMFFSLGVMMLWAGMYEGDMDVAIGGFIFFIFIGLLLPSIIYCLTSQVCPICKIKSRGSPLLDEKISGI